MRARRLCTVAVAILVVASACRTPGETAGEEGGPIKIGFVTALSSVSAESAQDMVDGWNLFWDQHGREVAGRKVQVFIEDGAGDPDVSLSKVRLLEEQRGVHMLVGFLFANVGLAVAEQVRQSGTPTFMPVACPDALTHSPIDNVIRLAGWGCSQPSHPFGEWLAEEEECDRVYTIGSDYAFGHEVVGGFVSTFTDAGGGVRGQVWNPIDETDFSSYLARISSANPDCAFALEVGATVARFIEAWDEFGLAGEIPLYLGEVALDQSTIRGVEPPELVENLVSAGHYAEGRDAPETQEFVEEFDEQFGKLPSYYAAGSFTAARWIAEALEEIDGDVEDRDAFLEAIKNLELEESPLGPLRLDEFGNPIQNIYIRKIEIREDGRPWNVVTETIPEVSPFYKYDPEEFMEQPVYSRDFQGS